MKKPLNDIGNYSAGEYTSGFVDGIMAMAKVAGLDFFSSAGVVKVKNKSGEVVLRFSVKLELRPKLSNVKAEAK